jgi:hypothetical protein
MPTLEVDDARSDRGVRQITVPRSACALSTLEHIDYADAFVVDVGDSQDRTAEHWARAILDDAPDTVRLRLWWSWIMLGLRLGPPCSRRRVLGWKVVSRAPDHVLLGAGSRIGMPAQLLVRREPGALVFDTLVQKNNRVARMVWARIEPTHERVLPALLRQFRRRAGGAGEARRRPGLPTQFRDTKRA